MGDRFCRHPILECGGDDCGVYPINIHCAVCYSTVVQCLSCCHPLKYDESSLGGTVSHCANCNLLNPMLDEIRMLLQLPVRSCMSTNEVRKMEQALCNRRELTLLHQKKLEAIETILQSTDKTFEREKTESTEKDAVVKRLRFQFQGNLSSQSDEGWKDSPFFTRYRQLKRNHNEIVKKKGDLPPSKRMKVGVNEAKDIRRCPPDSDHDIQAQSPTLKHNDGKSKGKESQEVGQMTLEKLYLKLLHCQTDREYYSCEKILRQNMCDKVQVPIFCVQCQNHSSHYFSLLDQRLRTEDERLVLPFGLTQLSILKLLYSEGSKETLKYKIMLDGNSFVGILETVEKIISDHNKDQGSQKEVKQSLATFQQFQDDWNSICTLNQQVNPAHDIKFGDAFQGLLREYFQPSETAFKEFSVMMEVIREAVNDELRKLFVKTEELLERMRLPDEGSLLQNFVFTSMEDQADIDRLQIVVPLWLKLYHSLTHLLEI